jgi:hypothetical protein
MKQPAPRTLRTRRAYPSGVRAGLIIFGRGEPDHGLAGHLVEPLGSPWLQRIGAQTKWRLSIIIPWEQLRGEVTLSRPWQ